MAYKSPTADFVTSALNGGITNVATSMTIGTGLNLPATNGILQIDYDSANAVGAASGPETISYAAYVSGTGAVTGIVRGLAGTTGVTHANGASVQSGMSSAYLQQSPQYDTWNAGGTLTFGAADSPTFTATVTGDSTAAIYPGVRLKADQTQAIQNYWSFDTNNADSKGGATMADIGTPTYTAGKFSNALTLNGSNQALSITDAASLKPTDNFTIGCWFKTSTATGVKTIFQSGHYATPNFFGFKILINPTTLYFQLGTGSGSGTTIGGTTTVTDGNWHYVVVSVRNNYTQMYLDGKLEGSGYTPTPVYTGTNYVRIGCTSDTGDTLHWHNGQIDDLFIAAYALDEQTIKAKYDAATAQGTGDLTLTKYFLCTASSYSAPNTTITMYGGTDHTLANSAISNVYYSTQKAPYGFPLGQEKWSVIYQVPSANTAMTTNTWYNIGTALISVPIGAWRLGYNALVAQNNTGAVACDGVITLSTSNSGETNNKLTSMIARGAYGFMGSPASREDLIKTSTKTTYYLIRRATFASGTETGYVGYAGFTDIIRATSTLL